MVSSKRGSLPQYHRTGQFGDAASLPAMFLTDGDVLQHVVGGAQRHRSPLMDALWLDVQDVLVASGGHAACLLNDVSHGVALVQQSQL